MPNKGGGRGRKAPPIPSSLASHLRCSSPDSAQESNLCWTASRDGESPGSCLKDMVPPKQPFLPSTPQAKRLVVAMHRTVTPESHNGDVFSGTPTENPLPKAAVYETSEWGSGTCTRPLCCGRVEVPAPLRHMGGEGGKLLGRKAAWRKPRAQWCRSSASDARCSSHDR